MATSSSYNFTDTRNEIIDGAFRKTGIVAEGETATAEMVNDAAKDLNRMVKGWMAQGIHIWKQLETVLFLTTSTQVYSLGGTANWVLFDDLTTTTLSAAAADTATSITVTSATGISASDNIGIVMDDNTIHWTTVNGAPVGTTVTLTDAIDDDAASGNKVYVYTTAAPRPLQIKQARVQVDATNEIEMSEAGSEGYFRLANKAATGVPVQFYYSPTISTGKLYVWPTTSKETYFLNMTAYVPIMDFDAASNNPDLPVEWFDALVWNLGKRLLTEYGITDPITVQLVLGMADETLKTASDFDTEEGDIILVPYMEV